MAGGGNVVLDSDGLVLQSGAGDISVLFLKSADGVERGRIIGTSSELWIGSYNGVPIILSPANNIIRCMLGTTGSLEPYTDLYGSLGAGGKRWSKAYIYGHRKSATITAGGEWWWAVRGTETPLLWGGDANYQYYKDFKIMLETDNAKIWNDGAASQNVAAFRLSG